MRYALLLAFILLLTPDLSYARTSPDPTKPDDQEDEFDTYDSRDNHDYLMNTPGEQQAIESSDIPEYQSDDISSFLSSNNTDPNSPKGFRPYGYMQFWARIYEQTENGRLQMNSKDEAAQHSSGFSFSMMRFGVTYDHKWFDARIILRMESDVGFSDVFIKFHLYNKYIELQAGQFKIPGTYEIPMSPINTDFPARSMFSQRSSDYSLARHASLTSPFQGVRPAYRDMGLALRGTVSGFKYFLMISNGIGANLAIGGSAKPQYIYANKFGAYFYGGRLSFDASETFDIISKKALIKKLEIGAFVNYNTHPNLLHNDQRTVLDLKRFAFGIDLQIAITDYLRLSGLYGQGHIDDDFDFDEKRDYQYSGWETKAAVAAIPKSLEFAIRIDGYNQEYAENGEPEEFVNYTFGASYRFLNHFKVGLDYTIKTEDSLKYPDDIKNNLLLLSLHAWFK